MCVPFIFYLLLATLSVGGCVGRCFPLFSGLYSSTCLSPRTTVDLNKLLIIFLLSFMFLDYKPLLPLQISVLGLCVCQAALPTERHLNTTVSHIKYNSVAELELLLTGSCYVTWTGILILLPVSPGLIYYVMCTCVFM